MQFTIRQMFAGTFWAAMACAVLFAVPSLAGAVVLGLAFLWLPVFLVCGLIYSRDWQKTFFLGATIAAAPICVPSLLYLGYIGVMVGLALDGMDFSDFDSISVGAASLKVSITVFFVYVCCGGLVGIGTRWLVSQRPPHTPTKGPSASVAPVAATQYAVIQGRLTTEVIPPD